MITSRCTPAAATEADASGEQQLKWMKLGSSSWSGLNRGAVRSDHAILVLARDTTTQGASESWGLHQTHVAVTGADEMGSK